MCMCSVCVSVCVYVCVCVCMYVCVLLGYATRASLPPLPELMMHSY